jgi:hypothetical protein
MSEREPAEQADQGANRLAPVNLCADAPAGLTTDQGGKRLTPGNLYADTASPRSELSEADFRGCRFIEGEATPLRSGMWCCAATAGPGSSWCPAHRGIVWSYKRGARRLQGSYAKRAGSARQAAKQPPSR